MSEYQEPWVSLIAKAGGVTQLATQMQVSRPTLYGWLKSPVIGPQAQEKLNSLGVKVATPAKAQAKDLLAVLTAQERAQAEQLGGGDALEGIRRGLSVASFASKVLGCVPPKSDSRPKKAPVGLEESLEPLEDPDDDSEAPEYAPMRPRTPVKRWKDLEVFFDESEIEPRHEMQELPPPRPKPKDPRVICNPPHPTLPRYMNQDEAMTRSRQNFLAKRPVWIRENRHTNTPCKWVERAFQEDGTWRGAYESIEAAIQMCENEGIPYGFDFGWLKDDPRCQRFVAECLGGVWPPEVPYEKPDIYRFQTT